MLDTRYPGPETIHRYVLDNGITLLVYENFATESVVLDGVVRAGAVAESAECTGLADFTAALLMYGTEKRPFDQIYEELEGVGAALDFAGGRHATQFSAGGLVEDLDLMLDMTAQSLCYPTFPVQYVEQVRGQILTGLQIRANDTQQMANLAFREMLYGEHPYGRSISGYPKTILGMTREAIEAFHQRYYGPQGMIVTVVGAIRAEEALAKVTAVLGNWRNPEQQPLPEVADVARPTGIIRRDVPMADKSQCDIYLGLPGPRRNAPDYMDASLMNTILGVFGMMGRIGQTVREEQGLAYYAYSHLQGGLGPSPWIVSMGVAPNKVEQAIESVRGEIGRMQNEPVPAEELADSQAYRTGSLPVSLETNANLAGIIGDMAFYDLGLDFLQRYPGLVQAVTVERIQAAAQKYLSVDQLAVAVAGLPLNGIR
ncbi:MAG: insulinase family protein [Ardenticatenaceae bacterium]|nr:insulinase family protein [Ardenticatenaceae bacterium]